MKKIIFAIIVILFSAVSCVEDNANVVLMGIVDEVGSKAGAVCTDTGGTNPYTTQFAFVSSCHMSAFVQNSLTMQKPWKSSGASSSGTTLDVSVANYNMIFVDSLVFACDRVDGEKKGCKDRDDIKLYVNRSIEAGQGACIPISVDFSKVSWGNEVTFKVYATFHDSGNISGKTSSTRVALSANASGCVPPPAKDDTSSNNPPAESPKDGSKP